MVSLHEDQAAGLRRLFARRRARILLVAAARGGAEQAALAVALARELAATGQRVVLIDEQAAPHNAASAFGIPVRFDLLQVINGDAKPAQVVTTAEAGIRLLSASRLARQNEALDARQQRGLAEMLRGVQKEADFVIVNALAARHISGLALAAQFAVIGVSAGSSATTEAYRLVKQLRSEAPSMAVGLVPVRCDGNEIAACRNLVDVAQRHLKVNLQLWTPKREDTPGQAGAIAAAVRALGALPRAETPAGEMSIPRVDAHRASAQATMVY